MDCPAGSPGQWVPGDTTRSPCAQSSPRPWQCRMRGTGCTPPFPAPRLACEEEAASLETPAQGPAPASSGSAALPPPRPVVDAAVPVGAPGPFLCRPHGPLGPEPTSHPHPWLLLPAPPAPLGKAIRGSWGGRGCWWEAPHSPPPPAVPPADLDLLGPPEGARWAAREDPPVTPGPSPGVPPLPSPAPPPPLPAARPST